MSLLENYIKREVDSAIMAVMANYSHAIANNGSRVDMSEVFRAVRDEALAAISNALRESE